MNAALDPAALLSLEGKIALVTGGAGGIGSNTAALLASAGAEVVCVDRPGAAPPAGVRSLPCDLADPAAVRALSEAWARDPGRLDLLVHCAGITRDGVLWKLEDEDWDAVLDVNLGSAFRLLRGFTPLLRARGGAVVLVSSINGERGKFGQANYAASKAGLLGLARTAARELGRFGVRVNALAPGLVRTRMTRDLPPDVVRRALEESALERLGEPEDVARAILFLCSDLGSYVTGQVLRVDGGQLMG